MRIADQNWTSNAKFGETDLLCVSDANCSVEQCSRTRRGPIDDSYQRVALMLVSSGVALMLPFSLSPHCSPERNVLTGLRLLSSRKETETDHCSPSPCGRIFWWKIPPHSTRIITLQRHSSEQAPSSIASTDAFHNIFVPPRVNNNKAL